MLGCEAHRLSFAPSPHPLQAPSSRSGGKVFLHAKVEVHALAESRFLESLGFRLIDTNLTFERPRGPAAPAAGVRWARPEDEAAVVALARDCFTLDRFHLDPEVPKQSADRLKGEWVRNFFRGERGAAMAVAETGAQKDEVAGFLLFLRTGDALVIDLVAVAPAHRGKGLAEAMTALGEARFPEAGVLRVGTQIGNAGAIRLYQKLGFRLCGSHYVFHYHGPMPLFPGSPRADVPVARKADA